MAIPIRLLRKQIAFFKPIADGCSIATCRMAQKRLGELMAATHRLEVSYTPVHFEKFSACWVQAKNLHSQGVVLYLHGGGYVAGDLEYAKGFGTILSAKNQIRVLCAAYRLAPENPFPAALEDALTAYRFLLKSGYDHSQIILAGESAGGGLCYALCLRLRACGLPLPAGILAISPWTDLTMSGRSYDTNRDVDPSMSRERLVHYARQYTDQPENPLVSPLFGDLSSFPPSLIFVGGDEVMRDDAGRLHQKLQEQHCVSDLVVAPEMWHAYLLYGIKEQEGDFDKIADFIQKNIKDKPFHPRWMRLDNAAKIYPAAKRRNWSNVFRVSVTFQESVDPNLLQSALEVTVRRFPSIAVRLRRGIFWYYLEQLEHAPPIREDGPYPCMRMKFTDIRACAFRVLYYKNRVAAEFFHALTDGNGGMIFLKTLAAEYIEQKYAVEIPAECGVLDRAEEAGPEELEDSFLRYCGDVSASRKEATAYHLRGTPEPDGYRNVICGSMKVDEVLRLAKSYHATLTCFLTSVVIQSILEIQAERVPSRRKQKPVKILLPVNLRTFFPSSTLRNFVLYTTPGIDPRMGAYSFQEIIKSVQHQMGLELTDKKMNTKITANVRAEQVLILRLMPLFIKNFAMKMVYNMVGERKSCLSLSNLGRIQTPQKMDPFLKRFDFILGTQATSPNNCGVLSYRDTLYIHFIRSIKEPVLEQKFFTKLRRMGIQVQIESNQR